MTSVTSQQSMQEFDSLIAENTQEISHASLVDSPLVSICCMAYNHERIIAQALDSFLMQKTDFPVEIIIGEDCSTDGTREIVLAYQKRHPARIRVILSKENLGKYTGNGRLNFLRTLKACRGKYIAICEGDDYWTDSSKLQKQVDFLEENPDFAICFHNVEVVYDSVDQDIEPHPFYVDDHKELPFTMPTPEKDTTIYDLAAYNYIQNPSAVLRNPRLQTFPYFMYTVAYGDWPLFLLVARNGNIRYMNEMMGGYRIHGDGYWATRSPEKMYQNQVLCMLQVAYSGEFADSKLFDSVVYSEIIKPYDFSADLEDTISVKVDILCRQLKETYELRQQKALLGMSPVEFESISSLIRENEQLQAANQELRIQFEGISHSLQECRTSYSYRLGHALLSPVRLLARVLGRKPQKGNDSMFPPGRKQLQKPESLQDALARRDEQITLLQTEVLRLSERRFLSPARLCRMAKRGLFFFIRTLIKIKRRRLKESVNVKHQQLDALPEGFDAEVYRILNPDLENAGTDLASHYLNHGRQEGRLFGLQVIRSSDGKTYDPDRETILIVSHQASKSGAPILCYNLAKEFIKRYNVLVFILKDGPLVQVFEDTGAAVFSIADIKGNQVLANLAIDRLCKEHNFKFALVNCIVSHVVLAPLSKHGVPALTLIHDFASYSPHDTFKDAFLNSAIIIFSAELTRENAQAVHPEIDFSTCPILPQGRCEVPMIEMDRDALLREEERIERAMRPDAFSEDCTVIMGAGSVELRKGVDLFIQCAARVVRTLGRNRCRFVWIGRGYDNLEYTIFLKEQIQRADLGENFSFVDETCALEIAYMQADLMLITSRLDPLPNVAIDAMDHAIPVLCFNKATGIADFLIESGLGESCVAEFMDVADLADKVLALASSATVRKQIGKSCQKAAERYFNMAHYVSEIEKLALAFCAEKKAQEEKAIIDDGKTD